MKGKIKNGLLFKAIKMLEGVLPAFFWAFLIFGFEEPYMALLSIIAAIIHEGGHIFSIMLRRGRPMLRGVISGFRIRSGGVVTYREELLTYLAGPLANLVAFIVLSLLSLLFGEWAAMAAVINLITALSNLLPIEGYDGYGMLRTYLQMRECGAWALHLVKKISSALIFILCIFSLYLIDRMGGGYWIFAVFFVSMIKCIKDELG
ncbi:MAG: hypothetical protein IJW93_00830 [Clostridia bacterium]|nr:hypothetical protein [Clostridia bacterium]